jgi:thiamine pyrophosphokinase
MPIPPRAIIFANGDLRKPEAIQALVQPDDLLIAADGGLKHMLRIGITPAIIIGDLDSAPQEEAARLEREGRRVMRYPREKDATDLELAIQQAVAERVKTILIVGALGGRLDQTLGNLALLSGPNLVQVDIRLEDGIEEVFLIRSQDIIHGQTGDTVSLIPFQGPAQGVETEGLQYPLRFETLYPSKTRGISNVMIMEEARVSVVSGTLICIHTRGER